MVLDRSRRTIDHRTFADIREFLRAGDVLVVNDSKVIPARLHGIREASGGRAELLLLEETAANEWWCMARPGKRLRPGSSMRLLDKDGDAADWTATVHGKNAAGHCHVHFQGGGDLRDVLDSLGHVPLPPYIERLAEDSGTEDVTRYQTVYARAAGSVAAPTAGLHFTPQLLGDLRARGTIICPVTLHVGIGTFAPVKASNINEHVMHSENYEVPEETARLVQSAKREGRRVVAVGTTSVRVLESVAARHDGDVAAGHGTTGIFIHPPRQFLVVDALLTNFHLPQSTLLMLVSAFASPGTVHGREFILHAYAEAVRMRYRFFSYGDAMFLHS